MPVGAHHFGEHPGITRVRLGARGREPVPVAGHRERVHRVDLVTGGHERSHQQAPVAIVYVVAWIGLLAWNAERARHFVGEGI